jgi:acyl-CoA thioester hydrolase
MSFRFATTVRVRLPETDAMGVAFHGSFFTWFDVARMDYVRNLALIPRYLTGELSNLIVRTEADFHAPARFEDVLVVRARISRIGRTSLEFRLRVEQERDGSLVAEGASIHVMIDPATRRPVPVPDDVRAAVRAFEGSAPAES